MIEKNIDTYETEREIDWTNEYDYFWSTRPRREWEGPQKTKNKQVTVGQIDKRERKKIERLKQNKIDKGMGMNQEEIWAKNKQKRLKIAHNSPPKNQSAYLLYNSTCPIWIEK